MLKKCLKNESNDFTMFLGKRRDREKDKEKTYPVFSLQISYNNTTRIPAIANKVSQIVSFHLVLRYSLNPNELPVA